MKVYELLEVLEEAVEHGKGDLDVVVDTEARKFNVHYAETEEAFVNDPGTGYGEIMIITVDTSQGE